MRSRFALLAVPFAMLAACTATTGPIVSTGEPGQYAVTSRSGGFATSWVELKSGAVRRARSYCESLGQKMTQPEVLSNHATGLKRPVAYVTFNCEPIPGAKTPDQDNSQAAGNENTPPPGNTPAR